MFFNMSQMQLDFEWFLSNCHIYKYPAKSTLIYQGEKAETLIYVINGIISVLIKDDEGKEMLVHQLSSGDFIGENGLFDKNIKQYKFWVKAKTFCEIAEIPYISFHRLIKVNINILIYLTAQMSRRLQNISSEKVGNLPFLSKMGRVAQILIHLSKSSKKMDINGVKIDVTSAEISKMIGYSKDVVNKILRMLQDQKIININKNSILVYM